MAPMTEWKRSENFSKSDAHAAGIQLLRERSRAGLGGRLAATDDRTAYEARLEAELALIDERGLAPWFLGLVERVEAMRAEGTPWAQGWGAAPSSLLLYALGATVIDPIRHGLLFERFVGPVPGTEPYVPFIVTSDVAVPQELAATWENATDGNLDEDAFEELVATLSLQRPSPEAAGVTAEYARRRTGSHRAALPALDAVTAKTRGLLLYDEQIIQAVARATGWSLLEAEAARRQMVRPGPGLSQLRDKFVSDAATRGQDGDDGARLFDILAASARTAIQKAHHVALAMVASKSARANRNAP